MPDDYMLDDGAVCVTIDGVVINGEKLDEFFEYAEQRYWCGQLRIEHTTIDGGIILTDVIRRKPDCIDIIRDTTRGSYDVGEISSSYYSFFRNTNKRYIRFKLLRFGERPLPVLSYKLSG